MDTINYRIMESVTYRESAFGDQLARRFRLGTFLLLLLLRRQETARNAANPVIKGSKVIIYQISKIKNSKTSIRDQR